MDIGSFIESLPDLESDPHEVTDQLSETAMAWFFSDIDFTVGKRPRGLLRVSTLMKRHTDSAAIHEFHSSSPNWSAISRTMTGDFPLKHLIMYHTRYIHHFSATNTQALLSAGDVANIYGMNPNADFLSEALSGIPAIEVPTYGGRLSSYRSARRNTIVYISDDTSEVDILVFPGATAQADLRKRGVKR